MPRKRKTETTANPQAELKDFLVLNTSAKPQKEEEPLVSVETIAQRAIDAAVRSYDFENKTGSTILENKGSYLEPTIDVLDNLANSPQFDLQKILQINSIIAKRINLDDIIGKVVESIYVNVNDEFRLSYRQPESSGRNKSKEFERAKKLIDAFNSEVNTKKIIRENTACAYYEGNVILYLRGNKTSGWCVDYYPLGVAIVSPYTVGSERVVLIDMNELKSRLIKSGFKLRNGKDMLFPTVEDELRENYPPEVYEAYKAKQPYAKLDVARTGLIQIGRLNGYYGVSPIFRALPSSIILQSFYKSDELNSKARSKKILLQILRKPENTLANAGLDIQGQAYAHKEIIKAYRQPGSVVYTAPNNVEKVEYVEPKSDMVNIDTVAFHLNREMSTLGIGFLSMESNNQSVSTAKISLEQLMKTINSITRQVEHVFEKFYAQVLIDSGFDTAYTPTMSILDSEYLEFELRKDLAQMFYTLFNGSRRTSLELLGINLDDEAERRRKENEDGLDEVFTPRLTAYTNGGQNNEAPTGRPKGEENDKQVYDETYNDDGRG